MKKQINQVLGVLGFEIRSKRRVTSKQNTSLEGNSMISGLNRVRSWDVKPSAIIDVGAAQGSWSLEAMKIWPESIFVLFEPLVERKNQLIELRSQHSNVFLVHAGAGEKRSNVNFYVTDDLDGSGVADNGSGARMTTIDITTIDEEITKLGLKGPFCIKLDTHGFEVPILQGANQTLQETELLIIECYGFEIAPGSLLFWEMCKHMDQLGFRLIDVVDIMRRKKDNAFWQCDAFFLRKDNLLFDNSHYN